MRLHYFSIAEFTNLKIQWQNLLSRSNADSLFLSWHWMFSWWEIYGNIKNDELILIGIYDEKDILICLAPLYITLDKIKNTISIKRLQFIGSRVGGSSGFRTEYLQFIIDKRVSTNAIKMIFDEVITKYSFDELWLSDLDVNSETYHAMIKLDKKHKIYRRAQEEGYSYGINVSVDYEEYVSKLGKNTRLKFFNRRKILNKLGKVTIEEVTNNNFRDVLNLLAEFQLHRWDELISYDKHSLFIEKLIKDSSIVICGVIVKLNDESIGCTFDILSSNRSYNIQSGYKEGVDKKIAMGSLTIGYAIEKYCKNEQCDYYDFLAGEGKNSNYKSRIAKTDIKFQSIQIISSTILRIVYKIKDGLNS